MAFKIFQRNTEAPLEKSTVYVTGNLKDKAWLETIAGDVLDWFDCQVYVADEFDENEDSKKACAYIKNMNLVIMVISSTFLLEESRAKDAEFQKIKEMRIPVLPIMVDEGIEELFNKVCGDLHLLNIHAADYKEKLLQHIQRIFIGTQLHTSIQKSFRGECFLSYRKKDREEALKLLHVLHQHEICRELAIWFDDFLILGEDYNEVIDEHLRESSFVILAVTPNILEPGNYVMNTEYKRAVELKKKIVPIELIPTDKQELNDKFPNLPECIDICDTLKLKKILFQMMQEVLLNNNVSTSEQDYYLGLAYVRGINTERDFEYGVSRLKKAAQAGHMKASQELGYIYSGGYTGRVDYKEALLWLENYVARYNALCQQGNLQDAGEEWEFDLAKVLRDLCDANMALGKYDLAKNALANWHNINSRFPYIEQTQSSTGTAAAYIREGKIYYIEKQYKEAEQALKIAEEKMEALFKLRMERVERNLELTLFKLQGLVYNKLFMQEQNPSYLQQSILYLEKALDAANEIIAAYPDLGENYELYEILQQLRGAYQLWSVKFNRFEEACKAVEYANKAYEQICYLVDNLRQYDLLSELFQSRRDYANSICILAEFLHARGELQNAKECYDEAIAMMNELCEKMPENLEYKANREYMINALNEMLGS